MLTWFHRGTSEVSGFSEETTKTIRTGNGHRKQDSEALGKAVVREPRKQVGPNSVTYPPSLCIGDNDRV